MEIFLILIASFSVSNEPKYILLLSLLKYAKYLFHRIPLSDGDVVGEQFQEGLTYRFDIEYDYGSCYYESDERTATCRLIGYNEEEIDNPNYKNELAQYNRNKKKHQEALEEWDKWKKIWDEEQEKERSMKIQNYDIVCLPYPTHPTKVEGSYMVSINLDNKFFECITKVKDPETGLDHIKEFIKDYEFVITPDLTIKETNLLGKHIFTKRHELYSTN